MPYKQILFKTTTTNSPSICCGKQLCQYCYRKNTDIVLKQQPRHTSKTHNINSQVNVQTPPKTPATAAPMTLTRQADASKDKNNMRLNLSGERNRIKLQSANTSTKKLFDRSMSNTKTFKNTRKTKEKKEQGTTNHSKINQQNQSTQLTHPTLPKQKKQRLSTLPTHSTLSMYLPIPNKTKPNKTNPTKRTNPTSPTGSFHPTYVPTNIKPNQTKPTQPNLPIVQTLLTLSTLPTLPTYLPLPNQTKHLPPNQPA